MNSSKPNHVRDKKRIKYHRYNSLWRKALINILVKPLARKYNAITPADTLPKGANLILANHVTVGDQYIMTAHFPNDYLYYVAGEDALRNPLLRWIGEKALGVIVHMRGVDSIKTSKNMLRHLKGGANIIIHPEGATCFDGRTKAVDEAIAKLAKLGGCNLVLVRIEGGYLTQPRWRPSVCTGEIELVTKIIEKDTVKGLNPKELTDKINQWIYTDAYAEQEARPKEFVGAEPCNGLQSCIYQCPCCGKIGTLATSPRKIFCQCGFWATMDDQGYLADEEGKKHTITQWCTSQKENLKTTVEKAKEKGKPEFLFEDSFDVKKVYKDGKRKTVGNVKLRVFTDIAEFDIDGQKGNVKLEDVENVFIFKRNQWNCHVAGKEYRYQLVGDFSSNALKYQDLWNIINS